MAIDPEMPFSREEMYLAKAAGEDVEVPECPWSRKEYYLSKIAEGGGGGGGVDIEQTTGQSTTAVMSQKAVTDIIGDVESILQALNSGNGAQ